MEFHLTESLLWKMFFKVTSDKDFQVTSDQIRNSIGRSINLALLSGRSSGAREPFLSPIFLHFLTVFGKNYAKQECIPVGCVPAARWPYAGVCFPGDAKKIQNKKIPKKNWGGGLVLGGMSGLGVSGPGGCLVQGVSGPGGIWSRRVSGPRGVSGPGVCVWYPSMNWSRHPPREQNDRQV